MFDRFVASHNLKYATPSRVPPDPTLFPNYIQNAQGLWLRYAEWWPRGVEVRGVVFIVSGYGEHSGRYDSVALRLNREGYVAFSVDNQGSGGSEGVRQYVERFAHFMDDIQQFVHTMAVKYPELTRLPRFLLGHSMGGLIATHVALRDPDCFAGVVLSGPAIGAVKKVGCLRGLVNCLSRVAPKQPLASLDAALVSRNAPVAELVKQDPYYGRGPMRARLTAEMLNAQEEVFANIDQSTFPFLIVFGEEDELCDLGTSRQFCDLAKSTDKQMKTYPGARHEVLTELCREQVMNDVMEFINKRCA